MISLGIAIASISTDLDLFYIVSALTDIPEVFHNGAAGLTFDVLSQRQTLFHPTARFLRISMRLPLGILASIPY